MLQQAGPLLFCMEVFPMTDFFSGCFDLCTMLFSQTDNLIVFIPTFSLFFCFCWAVFRRLSRL